MATARGERTASSKPSDATEEKLTVAEILDLYDRGEISDKKAVQMLEEARKSRHGIIERMATYVG